MAAALNREITSIAADVVHIQYPATGYGRHLGPQLLSVLRPMVVTIHECSQTHLLRRLSLLPLALRAQAVIFTNRYEQTYALRFVPWVRGRSAVIPIGTNVPPGDSETPKLPNVVTYFGLIRPQKGLEEVIHLARLFKQRANGLAVRIVGTVLPGSESYYAQLRNASHDLPLQWVMDLDGVALSSALAQTQVSYLPYPDGASERRGSLIAMLANKAANLTTHGSHTPSTLEPAVQFAESPLQAVEFAENLFNNPAVLHAMQQQSAELAARFSWNSIAEDHMAIYQRLAKC
jgi:glycosyltransferase involved in cell wall biosynthesis